MAATDSRPAVPPAPKALIPLSIHDYKLAEKRSAWRSKAKGSSSLGMTVGYVTFRLAGSPMVFDSEVVISFANDSDTDPTAIVRMPSGRFGSDHYQFIGDAAKKAKAEYDALATRACGEWLDWWAKQPNQQPLDDPSIAVALANKEVRGTSVRKALAAKP